MQIVQPVIVIAAQLITVSQEKKLGQIVKNYVTLAFVANIDTVFTTMLQADVLTNANEINKSGGLTITIDNNTNEKLFKRTFNNKSKVTVGSVIFLLLNLFINAWYIFLVNFVVIFYNYFVGMSIVIIQILGFFEVVYGPEYKLNKF